MFKKLFSCSIIFSACAFSMDEGDFAELERRAKTYLESSEGKWSDEEEANKRFDFFNGKTLCTVKIGEEFVELEVQIPDEFIITILRDSDLPTALAASLTCKRIRQIVTNNDFKRLVLNPKIKHIVEDHAGISFGKLVANPNAHGDYQINFNRINLPCYTEFENAELRAGGFLGNGDACLMLAESTMQHSYGAAESNKNFSVELYQQALKSRKLVGKNPVPCFDVGSEEYNSALFGVAYGLTRHHDRDQLLPFRNLERATLALLAMTDGISFEYGSVAFMLTQKLWLGLYERKHDQENSDTISSTRNRSREEKTRDFKLLASLFMHAEILGANLDITHGLIDGIHPPSNGTVHLSQIASALKNKMQAENFIRFGRTAAMPD